MANNVKLFFQEYAGHSFTFLFEVPVGSFAILKNWAVFYCQLFKYYGHQFSAANICYKYILPVHGISVNLLNGVFELMYVFHFRKVQTSVFSFHNSASQFSLRKSCYLRFIKVFHFSSHAL